MAIKIAIVTIDEPLYIPKMLKSIISVSPSCIEYIAMVVLPAMPKKMSMYAFALNQLQVFGISQFTRIATIYLFRKILGKIYDSYSVEKVARKHNIIVIKTQSLRSDDLMKSLESFSLDVILSVASSRIFGDYILSIPRLGCLNVHAGMLPKYRGVNPSFWALLNREKQSAVTVHYMNNSIDDGEIIQQDVFDIQGITSLHNLYLKILEIAPMTVVNSLMALKHGTVRTLRNNKSDSTYYSFPTKEDGKRFRELGLKYI